MVPSVVDCQVLKFGPNTDPNENGSGIESIEASLLPHHSSLHFGYNIRHRDLFLLTREHVFDGTLVGG